MLDFGFYNMDCMEGMKEFPDNYFDLAIVDPPYGINVGQASMGAGGAWLLTETGQRRICAPGGGNKTYIPFGGKKKIQGGGNIGHRRSQTLREKSEWGGVSCAFPKSIRRSMTATHRTPHISPNWHEWQKRESSGGQLLP